MEFNVEQIKKYSKEFVGEINNLLKQLNEASSPLEENGLKAFLASPASRLFAAKKLYDEKIIGMVTLVVISTPFGKKGLLEAIVVDRKYRGHGIATKLIDTLVNQARKEGVSHIDFTSNPKRVEANRLYEHLGFEKRNTNVYRLHI